MKFKVQKVIGNLTVQIEDEATDIQAFFRRAAFIDSLPQKCGTCHCDDVRLEYHTAKGFDFYEVVCNNPECGHSLKYGQYKNSNGDLFPKRWGPRAVNTQDQPE